MFFKVPQIFASSFFFLSDSFFSGSDNLKMMIFSLLFSHSFSSLCQFLSNFLNTSSTFYSPLFITIHYLLIPPFLFWSHFIFYSHSSVSVIPMVLLLHSFAYYLIESCNLYQRCVYICYSTSFHICHRGKVTRQELQ